MESHNKLSYADDRDKTYGVAGMAITIVALDAEDYLDGINLDGDPGEHILMSHDFASKGNPRMSAKIVWEQTLKDLRLWTSMALGNVVCRRYVLAHRGLTTSDQTELRSALRRDAEEHCGLDSDESDRLFDSCLGYVDRIFRHQGVLPIADSFARTLAERRTLTASEAIDILASLGLR